MIAPNFPLDFQPARSHRALRAAVLALACTLWLPSFAQEPTDPPVSDADPSASEAQQTAPPAPQPQAPSLEQAYQREFAFLQGQRRDLERRLEEMRSTMGAESAALEAEIRSLESDVVELRGRADRLDQLVFESERSVEAARENADLLSATFTQADFTLEDDWNDELGERAPTPDDVRGLFDAAVAFLDRGFRVTRREGAFFLADGARVDGEILRVGNIAAYGLSPRGSGVLAPAGDGEFKIWDAESADAAEALAAGQQPESLPIFLFESLNAEVEKKASRGLFELIGDGGVIGWIIFFLGLLGLLLVVLRVIFLQRASADTGKIQEAVGGHIERGDLGAAQEVLKRKRGATARVVTATIRNLDRDREHIEDIVSESILHENTHLNRFGALILVIAAVSPLLGLLGTVTGMIATFDVITEFGTGDPKLLSGGISIALVTTELGLIVAIPLILFGNLLSGWAENIKDDMEKAALRVINQYSQKRSAGAGEAA